MVLLALELLLTGLGFSFISLGDISITVAQIPVILATMFIGLPEGIFLAALFGLSSMHRAATQSAASLDYLFRNPLVSVLPRLLIPVCVWLVWRAVRKIADDRTLSARLICSSFSALCGTFANALFVALSMMLFVPESLGSKNNLNATRIVIDNLIAPNLLLELVSSVLFVCLFVLLFGKHFFPDPAEGEKPIRKTFQKWMLAFLVLAFFLTLSFMFRILTLQDRQSAERLMQEKCTDIAARLEREPSAVPDEDLTLGDNGYTLLVRDGTVIASGEPSLTGTQLAELGIKEENLVSAHLTDAQIAGTSGACLALLAEDTLILSFLPAEEIFAGRDWNMLILLFGMLILFLGMHIAISRLVQENVVQKIESVNASLSRIRAGELNEKVCVAGNTEFESLSADINSTVDALKASMAEIAERNRQEMEFAREVQQSVLPSAKQWQSAGKEFEIFASMSPAKEVGGDFFDYFLIDDDRLAFCIADVSGKGVPAALFMMNAKGLLKNLILSGKSPAEALTLANAELSETNEQKMFVTVWLGVLNYRSGELTFSNAAHNPPLLKKARAPIAWMDHKIYPRGFVLGGMPKTRYQDCRISFAAGDLLFLYTDGVTEANDVSHEHYGENRLLRCLEENKTLPPEALLRAVREDLDRFVGEAEQSDDITMLILKMNNGQE